MSLGVRLDAVGARADAEPIAQAGGEAAAGAFWGGFSLVLALVCFADAAEGGEALFHRGVAHASGVEGAVQVVGEATVCVTGRLGFLVGGRFWYLGFTCFFGLFGLFLWRVEIDTAGLVSLYG
jgi:hypothetical protein